MNNFKSYFINEEEDKKIFGNNVPLAECPKSVENHEPFFKESRHGFLVFKKRKTDDRWEVHSQKGEILYKMLLSKNPLFNNLTDEELHHDKRVVEFPYNGIHKRFLIGPNSEPIVKEYRNYLIMNNVFGPNPCPSLLPSEDKPWGKGTQQENVDLWWELVCNYFYYEDNFPSKYYKVWKLDGTSFTYKEIAQEIIKEKYPDIPKEVLNCFGGDECLNFLQKQSSYRIVYTYNKPYLLEFHGEDHE